MVMVLALVFGGLSVVTQTILGWLLLRKIAGLEQTQQALRDELAEVNEPDAGAALVRCADMGIGLAERMAKLQRGPAGEKRLQSGDKLRIALAFAAEVGKREGFEFSDADLRKTIEARLEVTRVAKSWRRTS